MTGETVWNVSNAVRKEMFELILADFAKSVGAGANKRIVLQLDNAGWHGPEKRSPSRDNRVTGWLNSNNVEDWRERIAGVR